MSDNVKQLASERKLPFELGGGASAIRRAVNAADLGVLAALCETLKMKSRYNLMYDREKNRYDGANGKKEEYIKNHKNIYVNGAVGTSVEVGRFSGVVRWVKERICPTPTCRDTKNVIAENVLSETNRRMAVHRIAQKQKEQNIAIQNKLKGSVHDILARLDGHMTEKAYMQNLRGQIYNFIKSGGGTPPRATLSGVANSVREYMKLLPIQSDDNNSQPWHSYDYTYSNNMITGTHISGWYPILGGLWSGNCVEYYGPEKILTALWSTVPVDNSLQTTLQQFMDVKNQAICDVFTGKVCEDRITEAMRPRGYTILGPVNFRCANNDRHPSSTERQVYAFYTGKGEDDESYYMCWQCQNDKDKKRNEAYRPSCRACRSNKKKIKKNMAAPKEKIASQIFSISAAKK